MFGVGKKSKKSRSASSDFKIPTTSSKIELVDATKEMQFKEFNLYYRTYLLVTYYTNLFRKINAKLK